MHFRSIYMCVLCVCVCRTETAFKSTVIVHTHTFLTTLPFTKDEKNRINFPNYMYIVIH